MKNTIKTPIFLVGILMLAFGMFSFWIKSTKIDKEEITRSEIIPTRNYVLNDSLLVTNFLPFDQGKSVPYEIVSTKHTNDWWEILFELSNELIILGLLVFVWEAIFHSYLQKKVEINQKDALQVLAYFLSEKPKEKKLNEEVSKLNIGSNVLKFENTRFKNSFPIYSNVIKKLNSLEELDSIDRELFISPRSGEYLFYNLGTVLTGYQDLMIDSTEREEIEHKQYIKIYQILRSIEFINDRFGYANSLKVKWQKEIIFKEVKFRASLILEICYQLKQLKDEVSTITKKELIIEKDIVCRLWNSVSLDSVNCPTQSIYVLNQLEIAKLKNQLSNLRMNDEEYSFYKRLDSGLYTQFFLKYLILSKYPEVITNKDFLYDTINNLIDYTPLTSKEGEIAS